MGPESIFKVLLAPELPPSLRYTKEDQGAVNEGGIKKKRVGGSSQTKDSLSQQYNNPAGKTTPWDISFRETCAGELTELLQFHS